jgi:hypothetical protein
VFIDAVLESSLAKYIASLAWTGRPREARAPVAGGVAGGGGS